MSQLGRKVKNTSRCRDQCTAKLSLKQPFNQSSTQQGDNVGLFTPGPFKTRTFTVPATPMEFYSVLFSDSYLSFRDEHPWQQLGREFARDREAGRDTSIAPLAEAIYITHADESSLSVYAGNRAKTYWTMTMMMSGSNPTDGEVTYERFDSKWEGNVFSLNADLRWAVQSIGGRAKRWPE